MGRPPKPTAKHRQEGTYRATRHDSREDAKFICSDPVADGSHNEIAAAVRQMVLDSFPAGSLTAMDAPTLNGMCEIYAEWVALRGAVEMDEIRLRCRLWAQFSDIASKFGMTPSDRAKMNLSSDDGKQKSPVLRLLGDREAS